MTSRDTDRTVDDVGLMYFLAAGGVLDAEQRRGWIDPTQVPATALTA